MGSLKNQYVSVRNQLDELGYREAFGIESLSLVEHLCLDLLKTTQNLQKYYQESEVYKKISRELEDGVEPFKEENLRLIKENSQLRLATQRSQEKLDEKLQGSKSRLRDLEAENTELKLLIGQFVERVKQQEVESLAKTRKMAQLQERNLQASVIIKDGEKKCVLVQKQRMEIDHSAPKLCPHCARIRNFVRFGQKFDRDPTPIDYIKVADSRIEALTLQNRSLKTTQNDLMDLIKSMKFGIEMRESELDKLKLDMKLVFPLSRDGVDKIVAGGDHDVESYAGKDAQLALKSAQLQLQVLQKRNLNLEKKLQHNFLQGHDEFMLHRSRSAAEKHLLASAFDDNGECMFLSNENVTMDEKLRLLETQLSHCCQEKAKLKALLEDCERKHQTRRTTPERDGHPKIHSIENILPPSRIGNVLPSTTKTGGLKKNKSDSLPSHKVQATRDSKRNMITKKSIQIQIKPISKQNIRHPSRAKSTEARIQNGQQKSTKEPGKVLRPNYNMEEDSEDMEKEGKSKQVGGRQANGQRPSEHDSRALLRGAKSTDGKFKKTQQHDEEGHLRSSDVEEEEQYNERDAGHQKYVQKPSKLKDQPISLSKSKDGKSQSKGQQQSKVQSAKNLRIDSDEEEEEDNYDGFGEQEEEESEDMGKEGKSKQVGGRQTNVQRLSEHGSRALLRAKSTDGKQKKKQHDEEGHLRSSVEEEEQYDERDAGHQKYVQKPSKLKDQAGSYSKSKDGKIHNEGQQQSKVQSAKNLRIDSDDEEEDYEGLDKDNSLKEIDGAPFALRGEYDIENQSMTVSRKAGRMNEQTSKTKPGKTLRPDFDQEEKESEDMEKEGKSRQVGGHQANAQRSSEHGSRSTVGKSRDGKIQKAQQQQQHDEKLHMWDSDVEEEEQDDERDAGHQKYLQKPSKSKDQPISLSKSKNGKSQSKGQQQSKAQSAKNLRIDSDDEEDYEGFDKDDSLKSSSKQNNRHPSRAKSTEDRIQSGQQKSTKEPGKILRPNYNMEEDSEDMEKEGKSKQVGGRQANGQRPSEHDSRALLRGAKSTDGKFKKTQQHDEEGHLRSSDVEEEEQYIERDAGHQKYLQKSSKLKDQPGSHSQLKESKSQSKGHQQSKVQSAKNLRIDSDNEEEEQYDERDTDHQKLLQKSSKLKDQSGSHSKSSKDGKSQSKGQQQSKVQLAKNLRIDSDNEEEEERYDERDADHQKLVQKSSKLKDQPGSHSKSKESKSQSKLQQQSKVQSTKNLKIYSDNEEDEEENKRLTKDDSLKEISGAPFALRGEYDMENKSMTDPKKIARMDRQNITADHYGPQPVRPSDDYGPPPVRSQTQQLTSKGSQEKDSPRMSSFKVTTQPYKVQNPYQSSSKSGHLGGYPTETEYPGRYPSSTTTSKMSTPWSSGYPRAPEGSRNTEDFPEYNQPYTQPTNQPYSTTGRVSPTPGQSTEFNRRVGYTPYTSALPNIDLTAADSRDMQQRIRSLERVIDNMKMKASLVDASKSDLENEVLKLRRALAECQEHGQQLKSEVQKAKIMLEQTEGLLKDTQRKAAANYVPAQRENQELTAQVRQLMAKEMVLEREVSTLSATVKALDRDKDEMRVELDRKDEKLARMQAEGSKHFDDLSKFQLQLKNAELQSSHTGETLRDQERELAVLRRERDEMKRELDKRVRERDVVQRELNALSQSTSKRELEKRHMTEELEKRGKESDDLKKQMQKYIDEVRRIEELLMKKDEEMEILMDNFRTLSQEKGALESQRNMLERQTSSARDVMDSNSTLSNKIASQSDLIRSYEEEISNLSGQVATLENQLRILKDSEKLLKNDVKAARDLSLKLETKLDSMRLDVANAESGKNKFEAENAELRTNIELMTSQLTSDGENQKKLEDLLTKMREKEYQAEQTNLGVTAERDVLVSRLSTINSRTEQLSGELERYRLRSAELQNELDKVKRQYQNEKIEREQALAELKRIQAQLSTSSTSLLMSSGLAPTSRTPSPSHFTQQGSTLMPPDLSPVPVSQSLHDTLIPSPVPDRQ